MFKLNSLQEANHNNRFVSIWQSNELDDDMSVLKDRLIEVTAVDAATITLAFALNNGE